MCATARMQLPDTSKVNGALGFSELGYWSPEAAVANVPNISNPMLFADGGAIDNMVRGYMGGRAGG
jgi:hypothetical protein